MRVLICGDRHWTDDFVIHTTLQGLLTEALNVYEKLVIIEGCAKGADSVACNWYNPNTGHAEHEYVYHEHYPADWTQHGKAAGPIRNRLMLTNGKPDLVFAFHNNLGVSKGTKHMLDLARKANLHTYLIGSY